MCQVIQVPHITGDNTMNNLLNIKTPAESIAQTRKADFNLSNQGVSNLRLAYWNLTTEALVGRSSLSQ